MCWSPVQEPSKFLWSHKAYHWESESDLISMGVVGANGVLTRSGNLHDNSGTGDMHICLCLISPISVSSGGHGLEGYERPGIAT